MCIFVLEQYIWKRLYCNVLVQAQKWPCATKARILGFRTGVCVRVRKKREKVKFVESFCYLYIRRVDSKGRGMILNKGGYTTNVPKTERKKREKGKGNGKSYKWYVCIVYSGVRICISEEEGKK